MLDDELLMDIAVDFPDFTYSQKLCSKLKLQQSATFVKSMRDKYDCTTVTHNVLNKWRMEKGDDAHGFILHEVLEEIGLKSIADKFSAKLLFIGGKHPANRKFNFLARQMLETSTLSCSISKVFSYGEEN